MPSKEGLDIGRRTWLKAVGAGAASVAAVGEVTASSDDTYHKVVNVAEEGAARDASEPINDILEQHQGNSVLFKFPEGRYLMDRQFRHTDFEEFGMAGDNATLVPAPADEFEGEPRLFKLGTHYAPGQRVRIENFTVDFTADNTGLRAFQCQVASDLQLRDIQVVGEHDSGTWGPLLTEIVEPGGTGLVENVRVPEGGAFTAETAQDAEPAVNTGPTGIICGPAHVGDLTFRNCEIGPFPDNGLYASCSESGSVTVDGGTYRNSNVANIRLAGESTITGADVVVDQNRERDAAQVGIRLDAGTFDVSNATVTLAEPNGSAIRVRDSSLETVLSGLDIRVGQANTSNDAVIVEGDSGPTTIQDSAIEMNSAGQALQLQAGDGAPTVAKAVTITGDATGAYGGRHAIRVDCDECELHDIRVSQPGPGKRRALHIAGDNVTVSGGKYHSSHHPVVNNASGTRIDTITAWAEGENEAVKLYGGNANVDLVYSTLYDGYLDYGTENLTTTGNEYPEGEPSESDFETQSESESDSTETQSTESDSQSTETDSQSTETDSQSTETESQSTQTDSQSTETESQSTKTESQSTETHSHHDASRSTSADEGQTDTSSSGSDSATTSSSGSTSSSDTTGSSESSDSNVCPRD